MIEGILAQMAAKWGLGIISGLLFGNKEVLLTPDMKVFASDLIGEAIETVGDLLKFTRKKEPPNDDWRMCRFNKSKPCLWTIRHIEGGCALYKGGSLPLASVFENCEHLGS